MQEATKLLSEKLIFFKIFSYRETVVAMEDPNTKKMGLLPETSPSIFRVLM